MFIFNPRSCRILQTSAKQGDGCSNNETDYVIFVLIKGKRANKSYVNLDVFPAPFTQCEWPLGKHTSHHTLTSSLETTGLWNVLYSSRMLQNTILCDLLHTDTMYNVFLAEAASTLHQQGTIMCFSQLWHACFTLEQQGSMWIPSKTACSRHLAKTACFNNRAVVPSGKSCNILLVQQISEENVSNWAS